MIKSASRSSITNDQKYRSMLAGTVPSSEYLIETVVVGAGGVSDIVFSNLAQFSGVYRHLQLIVVSRLSGSFPSASLALRFNGDTASNKTYHTLYGNGSNVISSASTGHPFNYVTSASGATLSSGAFAASSIDILDAFSTTKFKTIRGFGGLSGQVMLESSLWQSTNAASSLSIITSGLGIGSFVEGTRFSLYGVTA